MTTRATGIFDVKSWDEMPYNEVEGLPKLTRASVTGVLHGDVEGEATIEFVMAYPDENSATFVGLLRVVGTIGGRSGGFVLQTNGTFEGGTAKDTWSLVRGTGTGDLRGLHAEGGSIAPHDVQAEYTLNYSFD